MLLAVIFHPQLTTNNSQHTLSTLAQFVKGGPHENPGA